MDSTAPHADRVKMAGIGEDMKPVFAEHSKDSVVFGMTLHTGQPGVVTGPKLTRKEATAWIKDRLDRFENHAESRESVEDAIRRKVIAAQGAPFVHMLKLTLPKMLKMELEMMVAPASHSNGANLAAIRAKKNVVQVKVDATGHISGHPDLPHPCLTDDAGRALCERKGE